MKANLIKLDFDLDVLSWVLYISEILSFLLSRIQLYPEGRRFYCHVVMSWKYGN